MEAFNFFQAYGRTDLPLTGEAAVLGLASGVVSGVLEYAFGKRTK
jgi:hypothetical protein